MSLLWPTKMPQSLSSERLGLEGSPGGKRLTTKRLVLRPWRVEDADELIQAYGDAEVMQFWNTPPIATTGDMVAQIERSLRLHSNRNATWVLTTKSEQRVVGTFGYHHRERLNQRLEIAYILARPYWRQGLMLEAGSALLEYFFSELNVHRAEALINPQNIASQALVLRLGFACESGPLRDRLRVGEGWADVKMYSLLAVAWDEVRKKLQRPLAVKPLQ